MLDVFQQSRDACPLRPFGLATGTHRNVPPGPADKKTPKHSPELGTAFGSGRASLTSGSLPPTGERPDCGNNTEFVSYAAP